MKTGRPKGPEKVMFRASVTPEMAEYMKRLAKDKKASANLLLAQAASLESQSGVVSKPVEHDPILHLVNINKEEVNELKGQINLLLEDIQRLTDQVDLEQLKYLEAMDNLVSEQAIYWKGRCAKAEAEVKQLKEFP